MSPEKIHLINMVVYDVAFMTVVITASLIAYTLLGYPKLVCLFSKLVKKTVVPSDPEIWPAVSILVAVHNGEKLVEKKISNSLLLDYPKDKLEIVITTDGCTDRTVDIVKSFQNLKIVLVENITHLGKNTALENGYKRCSGEIIVVSDTDAILDPPAIKKLVRWFSYPWVGGVRGSKVMVSGYTDFNRPLATYNNFQHRQNECESNLHSSGTNEGKLHAIRKTLFTPLMASNGCDDTLNLFSVVRSGYRFLIDTSAKAFIPVPVISPAHEIERRRRMIKGTFLAMRVYADLFNPLKYGWFAWTMWSFRLFRRLVPVFHIILILGLLILSLNNSYFAIAFVMVNIFPLIAYLTHVGILKISTRKSRLNSLHSSCYYFILGMWGTFRGFLDFILGTGFKGTWKVIKDSTP